MTRTNVGLTKRGFLAGASAAAGLVACGQGAEGPDGAAAAITPPPDPGAAPFGGLTDLTGNISRIDAADRRARIAKVQAMLQQAGVAALLVEPGSTMRYFAGLRWGLSERLTAIIIPAEGEMGIVTPGFEEATVRERMSLPAEVRVWQEDESPFALVAQFLDDRGLKGPLAIEDSVRFFVSDGMRTAVGARGLTAGGPFAFGCRMIKSAKEIALMQVANTITMAAYRHTYDQIETGMSGRDIVAIMNGATRAAGGDPTFAIALVGEGSSYPHGTKKPQTVAEGRVLLMDCGCSVDGYQSDISRTWVHGTATAAQKRVWAVAKAGQELALQTAQVGTPAGLVDRTVRAFYAQEGFGPDYITPGLPHRLGHGIGMDVHEPINFVRNEITPLAPGMCLSNEPGIYLPGAFGVRLEDCIYMTEDGPQLFSGLAPSMDDPIG